MENYRYPGYQPDSYRVATLGDASAGITCSTHVAKRLFPKSQIIGVETFEGGADIVRRGGADGLFVPSAYPNLRALLMDETLKLVWVTSYPIPSLVATAYPNKENRCQWRRQNVPEGGVKVYQSG